MTYEWKDLGECSIAEVVRELQGRVGTTAVRVDMRVAELKKEDERLRNEIQGLRQQTAEADGELRKRVDKAEIGLKLESAYRRQQVGALSRWCADLQARIAETETELKALRLDTAHNDGIAKAESDRRHVELVGYIRAVEKRMDGLQVHAAAQEASLGQLERKLETLAGDCSRHSAAANSVSFDRQAELLGRIVRTQADIDRIVDLGAGLQQRVARLEIARETAVKSGLKEVCAAALKEAGSPAPAIVAYLLERFDPDGNASYLRCGDLKSALVAKDRWLDWFHGEASYRIWRLYSSGPAF